MKYAKQGVALLFLLYLFVFGIDGLGIYLTRVFNGDLSFLYFMYLILYSLLLIAILFWLKAENRLLFKQTEMEVVLSGVFCFGAFVVLF